MIASLLSNNDNNVARARTGIALALTARETVSTIKTSEIGELLNFFISEAGLAVMYAYLYFEYDGEFRNFLRSEALGRPPTLKRQIP